MVSLPRNLMKRIVFLLFMFSSFFLYAAAESYMTFSLGWSYDTNIFSTPYPVGYDPDTDDYPNGGKYIKRHNVIASFDADLFFSEGDRFGLSVGGILALPVYARTVTPSLADGNLIHTESADRDAHLSLFFSVGSVFRYSWDSFTLLLPIRLSIGTYDWFASGVILGVNISPSFQVGISDFIALRCSFLYDIHFMKLFSESAQVYDDGYIMLNAGASIGFVLTLGGEK